MQSQAGEELVWRVVRVATKATKKEPSSAILKGVSGSAKAGEVLAIMGPSGSGKTTLLNVLARGKHASNTTMVGDVRWNNQPITAARQNKFIAYVEQHDSLLGVFTVRELLMFSAKLRLPFSVSSHAKAEKVQEVITQLHLDTVADRKVGDDKVPGLSGGERRRVSVGLELVTSPKVLILDEPTSGLDSHIAKSVVETLTSLARTNSICLMFTIHQPSSSMFKNFDKLCLMTKGNVVFLGQPLEALRFFEGVSPALACPELTNPAEHLLDVVTGGIGTGEGAKEDVPATLTDAWAAREQDLLTPLAPAGDKAPLRGVERVAPWWYQLVTVLAREWKNFIRDPYYFYTQFGTNLFLSVFMGLMYFQVDNNNDRFNAMYFALLNVCFVPFMSVMIRFPLARKVFNREKEVGYYGTASFFFAYFLVDIPMQVLMTLSLSLPFYWMAGFTADFGHFVEFNVWLYLMFQVSQSLGLACTAMFPTITGSMGIGSFLLIMFMSFGGYFLDLDSIPDWFNWISHISMFRYSFEALVVTELHDREGGREFYRALGMKDQRPFDALMMVVFIVVYRSITFVSLRFFKGNTRL